MTDDQHEVLVSDHVAPSLPVAVTSLMKGVVYRDEHPKVWRDLVRLQPQMHDFFSICGLIVIVDETEGFAFLRQRPDDNAPDSASIPRLIARQPLSFSVSLMLALLRERLALFDARDGGTRLIVTADQIYQQMVTFLPQSSNEVALTKKVQADIDRVLQLGFLRRVNDEDATYEVRRIIKAFIDADRLAEFSRNSRAEAGLDGPADGDAEPALDAEDRTS